MWWLDSEKQTIPTKTQSLLPRPRHHIQAVAPVGKQPIAKRAVTRRAVAKRSGGKCRSPLIDTLTPEQEQANRILSQIQCGHEAEIERLLDDIGSLEKSIRQSALNAESQQAILDEKESLLRLAKKKSETLQFHKNHDIGELEQLRDQLAEAEKRATTWQLETQRSHASRRALAEQMRRQRAEDDEALQQSDSQRQQIEQLKTSIELRDREIIGLKEALTASQLEIGAAWHCSKEAASQLQMRDAELQRARENEERFVQIQADQAETLQIRINSLVDELDSAQDSSRINSESFERTLAELKDVINQLENDHGQLKHALNLAQQTNMMLVTEAAKSRAQLSVDRDKGTLLIERYEERLRQAFQAIDTLRAQPNARRENRAA